MALTEKELLMLDIFMYSDLAPQNEKMTLEQVTGKYVDSSGNVSVELIQRDIDSGKIHLSGDLKGHPEYLADTMNQIRGDPNLTNLQIDRTTPEYEGSIRAACFVDQSGEATVAFRGTGGSYRQWSNNFEGYGDVSQQTERDAADFINSLPYNNMTVTGHSNGGNQAMYVTVVCGDKISRCVSYEGQGVSKQFVNEYGEQITANQGKIKNICGQRDFVSPIMKDIAGETVYVKSDSSILFGMLDHGAYGILSYGNKHGSFDGKYGDFRDSAYVEQSWIGKTIHGVTEFLDSMSDVPVVGPILELVADAGGGLVGMIISEGLNMFNLFDPHVRESWGRYFDDLVGSLKDFGKNLINDGKRIIENGINTIREFGTNVYNKFMDWISGGSRSGSSSGGHSGGGAHAGGRANVIRVSTEDMAAAIRRYQTEKNRLMDAVKICNNASRMLAQSWAGPSFAALSVKMASTYKNLYQSITKMDDAIEELNQTIRIMEGAERKVASSAAALDLGVSPFA